MEAAEVEVTEVEVAEVEVAEVEVVEDAHPSPIGGRASLASQFHPT